MNPFRASADFLNFFVFIWRLRISNSAIGLSIKTQELHLFVFLTRYIDLSREYNSLYISVMKMLYITLTAFIICMVKGTEPYNSTIDMEQDSFRHYQFAVAPCMVLAVVTNFIQNFIEGFFEDFDVMGVSECEVHVSV